MPDSAPLPDPTAPVLDRFDQDCRAGRVIGSRASSGAVRLGIDAERQMTIDRGALRLRPLVQPGWGRQGIAYGPYARTNGLALAVFLLNGHNTSQSGSILQSLKIRLLGWAVGLPTEGRVRWRLLRRLTLWLRSYQPLGLVRKLRYWAANTPERFQLPEINENLAVGWFPEPVPTNPLHSGNAVVIHATGPENGELWTRVCHQMQSAFKGLQNLQTYYVVILRETGAAYYAAAVPRALGLAAYPRMRPIAIDTTTQDPQVYAAVYQSVLGQIGFMVDTRVYGVQVAQLPDWATWYGTAHAADSLRGSGLLHNSSAETGGHWILYRGYGERTAAGCRFTASSLAMLTTDVPAGLIHLQVQTGSTVTPIALIWRAEDKHQFWRLQLSADGCRLYLHDNGSEQTIAASSDWSLQPQTCYSVQVLDDGQLFRTYLNGQCLFNTAFSDTRLHEAKNVGLEVVEPPDDLRLYNLEAHPRQVPIPAALDLGVPWLQTGQEVQIADAFEALGDLQGQSTRVGHKIWHREQGNGVIEGIGNHSAQVRATVDAPNPGRTLYTLDWDQPEFADVEVEITPPGSQRGMGEEGRAGLVFWQDPQNYIIVNNWLNNDYAGASISSFFTLRGFEDLYDAVWTNIGDRIYWGVPHRFRIVFDGMQYSVLINDEPVLYRALTDVYPNASRLAIRRIGIVANWEWGDDTGSRFRNLIARS